MNTAHETKKGLAAGATALLGLALLPGAAAAKDAFATDDGWQYRATVYGFFPDISGSAAFPAGGTDINIDAETLVENTDLGFMGLFEARKGRWGLFTDLIWLDLGDSKDATSELAIGGGTDLPPGVTADVSLDVDARIWTLGGSYRVLSKRAAELDVVAGARLLDLDGNLEYAFNTDIGPFAGPARAGSAGSSLEAWDAIVGAKGRVAFGADREWVVDYYADVGTGDSDLTWQAVAGVGRSFGWGEVSAAWRHLDYGFDSDSKIEDLDFDGPALGLTFRW
jgi:hypothetical protein